LLLDYLDKTQQLKKHDIAVTVKKHDKNRTFILKKAVKKAVSIIFLVKNRISGKIGLLKNHYVLPFLVSSKIYPPSSRDKYCFVAGYVPCTVLTYDEMTLSAVKMLSPKTEKIILAKHPIFGKCKTKNTSGSFKNNKMLVLFSGNVADEPNDKKIDRWINTISKALDFASISQVDIRLHPRTLASLNWPKTIMREIESKGHKVSLVDSLKVPLVDTLCDYSGIVGAPSGALIVARAMVRDVFIVCLPNNSDCGPEDQEWTLGKIDGINFVREGEELEKKHLELPKATDDYKPTAAHALLSMIFKENR
jgi:hypothetical protein